MEHIVLGSFLLLCVILDYRIRKIPNWLCVTGAFTGCLVQYFMSGTKGMMEGFFFAMAVCAVLLPFWYLHILGGGDVKLMLVSGFYLKREVFVLLFLSAVCTACYSLILMTVRKNFVDRMKFFAQYIRFCIMDGIFIKYPFDRNKEKDCKEAGVPVSYGILAGFLVGKLTGLLG